MTARAAWLAIAGLMLLAPHAAGAQAYQCRMPERLSPLPPVKRPANEPRRVLPVTGYTLALSWSPEFCKGREDDARQRLQCSRDHGEFGFVLHGLWPEASGPRYPQYCAAQPARVPQSVVRSLLCDMPSPRLIEHQWLKHGSCMARDPASYFRVSTTVYRATRIPDMERLSRRPLTYGMLRRAFAQANPGMQPDTIAIKANARGWLQEVRICLGRNLKPNACPRHVRQPRGDTMIKIWRGL
ncbi:ribonuclease T(2) [Blastomonas sp.]|uniref:ribonuclease T2 family protein n=1 Tax=Blastomonas sp. TaxID=1909299 RepID=UPI00359324A7